MTRFVRCARLGAAITGALTLGSVVASCHGTTAPKATQVLYNAGNDQTAAAGSTLPIDPSVLVLDQQFKPVQGFQIVFSVTMGGGTITGDTASTDAAGIATVGSWTLGTTPGPNQLTILAFGLSGSGLTFSATGN